MTTPTPKFCYHGNAVDCCDACDREETIGKLKSDLAAAQEALRRATTPVANVTLSGDAQYWQDRAQRAEALAESNARDAERYRWLKAENSSMESWRASVRIALDAYTEETGHQGDELDAAIDAAMKEGK